MINMLNENRNPKIAALLRCNPGAAGLVAARRRWGVSNAEENAKASAKENVREKAGRQSCSQATDASRLVVEARLAAGPGFACLPLPVPLLCSPYPRMAALRPAPLPPAPSHSP